MHYVYKLENTKTERASIPGEERTCLICNRNCIEDEEHFLTYCQEYDDIRRELHSVISKTDSFFTNLTDEDKTGR